MIIPKVFFIKITGEDHRKVSDAAAAVLRETIKDGNIKLEKEIPLKIHTGQPGNTSFVTPDNYKGIVNLLLEKKIKTYFVETGMVTGPRSGGVSHRTVAKKHGFIQVPFVVADGDNGKDHVIINIAKGIHLKSAMIAKKLADQNQIIVLSHFKGHCDAGFGAALKMLGIGFASRQGKMEVHLKHFTKDQKTIDWSKGDSVFHGPIFRKRMADYALAAVNRKHYIYITFALSLVENCDCDGCPMEPIYEDLGIFASIDPVAIDKACFDLLEKREGKKPFDGDDVFPYAEKIGLGSQKYRLVTLR